MICNGNWNAADEFRDFENEDEVFNGWNCTYNFDSCVEQWAQHHYWQKSLLRVLLHEESGGCKESKLKTSYNMGELLKEKERSPSNRGEIYLQHNHGQKLSQTLASRTIYKIQLEIRLFCILQSKHKKPHTLYIMHTTHAFLQKTSRIDCHECQTSMRTPDTLWYSAHLYLWS